MFPKTLEEIPVESNLVESQVPCDQICGEDSVLSEFSKNCDEQIDVNSITVAIKNEEEETRNANVGEIAIEGFENDGEFFKDEGVAEGSEMTKASSLKCNNGANNGDGSEVGVAIEDEGDGVGMAEETLEKIDDATQVRPSDPPRNADGLSLFVEVFGSLDGIYEVEDGEFGNGDVLTESEKMPCEGNETLTSHNCVDATAEDLQGPDLMLTVITDENVGNQKGNFVVGDVVWIKTKTDLWWPGVVVTAPSSATKDAGAGKKGSLLVKYFGNANSVWRFPIHLKHFVQFFDEMVQQNNSRIFYGAVERAANEIGRRVKEEMTCSCFSKGSSVQAASAVTKQKIDDLRAYSVSQFEPVNFLAQIKCLAQDGSLPGKIKLIVTQNCLSAFYHSLGHCQLPVHQLRPTEVKYGTQCGPTPEKEYSKRTVVLRGKSRSLEKCGGEADQRQSSSSTLTLELMEDKKESRIRHVEIIAGCNTTSPEISHSSTITSRGTTDGSQVGGQTGNARVRTRSGKGSANWSRERKKSKYLSFPYVDPNKGTPTSGQNETGDSKKASDPGKEGNGQILLKRGSSKSSCGVDEVCKPEDVNTSSADMLSELLVTAVSCSCHKESRCSASIKRLICCFRRFAFLNHEIAADNKDDEDTDYSAQTEGIPSSDAKPKKRKRKKKEALTSLFPGIVMDFTNGSLVHKFQQSSTDATQMKKVSRKRKKTVAISDIEEGAAQLPDTNSSIQGLQVSGNSVSKRRRGRKKRKLEENPPTKNGCGLYDLHGKCVKFVELLKDVQKGGSRGPGLVTTETKIRQQEAGTEPNSTIPDLNGNVGETATEGNYLADLNSVLNNNKPRRRRRRRKSTVADVADKVVKNEEFSGAILLYFASDVPLPSIESLLTTFAGYGTLKESETRYLPDSSAQVFFVQSSDALKAFRSLQEDNLFGQALENCRLVYHSSSRNTSIPDLNNATDTTSVQNNDKPRRRRRRKKKDLTKEEISGAIVLNFDTSVALPSMESLVTTFAGYGAIKESETRFLNESSAQIAFLETCNAMLAFQSLQASNPFGAALAGYRFVYLSSSAPRPRPLPSPKLQIPPPPPPQSQPLKGKNDNNDNKSPAVMPMPPDLLTIKQNLEMMKSMLEKAGNNLSTDMRSKLEIEIKGLMQKVNSSVACSSTTTTS